MKDEWTRWMFKLSLVPCRLLHFPSNSLLPWTRTLDGWCVKMASPCSSYAQQEPEPSCNLMFIQQEKCAWSHDSKRGPESLSQLARQHLIAVVMLRKGRTLFPLISSPKSYFWRRDLGEDLRRIFSRWKLWQNVSLTLLSCCSFLSLVAAALHNINIKRVAQRVRKNKRLQKNKRRSCAATVVWTYSFFLSSTDAKRQSREK